MLRIMCFLALSIPYTLLAQDIRLKGALKEKKLLLSGLSRPLQANTSSINKFLHRKIFKNAQQEQSSASISSGQAPLYAVILQELQDKYESIGRKEAGEIQLFRKSHALGGLHHGDIKWGSDFEFFSISTKREVVPDLFSDKWIKTDKFYIRVSAKAFFQRLIDEDLVELEGHNLGAYAGLSALLEFQTQSTYDKYEDGLTSPYEALFLPFQYESPQRWSEEDSPLLWKRSLYLTAQAGAGIHGRALSLPVLQLGAIGLDMSLGLRGSWKGVDSHSIKKEIDHLLVTREKGRSISAEVEGRVSINFLQVFSLALLDISYKYEQELQKIDRYAFITPLNFQRTMALKKILRTPAKLHCQDGCQYFKEAQQTKATLKKWKTKWGTVTTSSSTRQAANWAVKGANLEDSWISEHFYKKMKIPFWTYIANSIASKVLGPNFFKSVDWETNRKATTRLEDRKLSTNAVFQYSFSAPKGFWKKKKRKNIYEFLRRWPFVPGPIMKALKKGKHLSFPLNGHLDIALTQADTSRFLKVPLWAHQKRIKRLCNNRKKGRKSCYRTINTHLKRIYQSKSYGPRFAKRWDRFFISVLKQANGLKDLKMVFQTSFITRSKFSGNAGKGKKIQTFLNSF